MAQDIIEAEAVRNPDVDKDCLLEQLNEFSNDDLKEIGELLGRSDADSQNEGAALLGDFEAALATCT